MSDRETCNVYYCETCGNGDVMSFGQMREHLINTHGIDLATALFNKTMISHLDMERSYASNYRLIHGGVAILQTITAKRGINDPMRR